MDSLYVAVFEESEILSSEYSGSTFWRMSVPTPPGITELCCAVIYYGLKNFRGELEARMTAPPLPGECFLVFILTAVIMVAFLTSYLSSYLARLTARAFSRAAVFFL